jgi:hypothetical protein
LQWDKRSIHSPNERLLTSVWFQALLCVSQFVDELIDGSRINDSPIVMWERLTLANPVEMIPENVLLDGRRLQCVVGFLRAEVIDHRIQHVDVARFDPDRLTLSYVTIPVSRAGIWIIEIAAGRTFPPAMIDSEFTELALKAMGERRQRDCLLLGVKLIDEYRW